MSENKKAWMVRDEYEGHCTIVFNNHGLAARREGAEELGTEFPEVTCQRAPGYDSYSEKGFVPPKVLIEDGWWFECLHCGVKVDNDGYNFNTDEPMPLEDVIEHGENAVFCGKACKDAYYKEIDDRNELFRHFKAIVKEKRPDLEFVDFRGGYPMITMSAFFTFPGATRKGEVRDQNGDGDLKWTVARADLEAWSKYESNRNAMQ